MTNITPTERDVREAKELKEIPEEPKFKYNGPHRKDIIDTLFYTDQETDGEGHNVGSPYLVYAFGYQDTDATYDNLEELLQAVHELIERKVETALAARTSGAVEKCIEAVENLIYTDEPTVKDLMKKVGRADGLSLEDRKFIVAALEALNSPKTE